VPAPGKSFDYSRLIVATGVSFGTDKFENPIALFPNDWTMRYFVEKNPEFKLLEMPPELVG
jgi:peptide chain release factor 3